MTVQSNNNLKIFTKDYWEDILKRDSSYHVFFWLSLYIILVVLDNMGSFSFRLIKELINVVFFAIMVYINILILFPKYLTQKNLLNHLFSLAIVAILITPLKTLSLFLLGTNIGSFQAYILKHRMEFFLSTFFIGIASTIYGIMNDWLENQREKKELQNQTLQSELKFLKSQINPHFLFNTLNSLYALTLKKSDKAPEIVLKLSEMMRYMLYECNEREVLLSKEVSYIESYLELEKIRQGKNMDINFITEGEMKNQKIAPLMFIPFIENSFKHGINNQITDGYVNILLEINDQELKMTIENSKATILPKSTNKKSGGIGLVNVKRRLKLLYPERYKLTFDEDQTTYTVNLRLDLHKSEIQNI
ncbi:MAG: histidine kinase [Saprospiraceae bacterium]